MEPLFPLGLQGGAKPVFWRPLLEPLCIHRNGPWEGPALSLTPGFSPCLSTLFSVASLVLCFLALVGKPGFPALFRGRGDVCTSR